MESRQVGLTCLSQMGAQDRWVLRFSPLSRVYHLPTSRRGDPDAQEFQEVFQGVRGSQVRSLKATYGLESQRRWVPRSQSSERRPRSTAKWRSLSFTSLHSVSSTGSQAEDSQEVFVKQANEQKNDLLAASQVLSKVILTQSYRAGVMNSHPTVQEIKFRGVMSFS